MRMFLLIAFDQAYKTTGGSVICFTTLSSCVLFSTIAPPAGELVIVEVDSLGPKCPLKVIQSLGFSFTKKK